MTIAERIKQIREARGMSQREVAKALGISQPAYYYFESGDRVPSLAMTKALARVFEVTLDELAGDTK